MLMLRNEPADQWLSVLNHGNHRKDGYIQEYFKMEKIKSLVGEAGVRKQTDTFLARR